jgi:hypothetical protein
MKDNEENKIPQSIIVAHALGLISSFPEPKREDRSFNGWKNTIKNISKNGGKK